MVKIKYSARVKELTYKLNRAATDREREIIVEEFLGSSNNIPPEIKKEIREEAKEDLEDDLRYEIEEEIEEKYEERYAWVYVQNKNIIERSIRNTIESLEIVLDIVRSNNSISSPDSTNAIMTPIQKEILLAVLKAAISELEAPYVNKGKVSELLGWLGRITKNSVEKGLSKEITDGFEGAFDSLGKLWHNIKNLGNEAPF